MSVPNFSTIFVGSENERAQYSATATSKY